MLEGVAFGLRDSLQALVATDAKLNQLIATALGVPLSLPKSGEFGAALGAARLGMTAATGATPDSIMTIHEIRETIEPNQALRSAFNEAYQGFRAAYPAIKACQ